MSDYTKELIRQRNYAYTCTEEHKANLSKALSNENNPKAKPVICIETNELFLFCKKGAEIIYNNKSRYKWIKKSIVNNKKVHGFSWRYPTDDEIKLYDEKL